MYYVLEIHNLYSLPFSCKLSKLAQAEDIVKKKLNATHINSCSRCHLRVSTDVSEKRKRKKKRKKKQKQIQPKAGGCFCLQRHLNFFFFQQKKSL